MLVIDLAFALSGERVGTEVEGRKEVEERAKWNNDAGMGVVV